MKTIFALMHKPSLMSIRRDPVIGVFENEQDANEALEREKSNLRLPFIKAFEVVDSETWKRRKTNTLRPSLDALSGDGGPHDHYNYPAASHGPGTMRSGRGGRHR